MITSDIIKQLYSRLIHDESFCRLIAYGKDPMGEDKTNIIDSSNYLELMEDIIKFSPQFDTLEELSRTRLCMYKGYTKLKYLGSATVQETVQFDIYVPFALVGTDLRMYQIENKIVSLLDNISIGIGYLEYTEGQFIQLPPISGYAQYKMVFVLQEGRPTIARR